MFTCRWLRWDNCENGEVQGFVFNDSNMSSRAFGLGREVEDTGLIQCQNCGQQSLDQVNQEPDEGPNCVRAGRTAAPIRSVGERTGPEHVEDSGMSFVPSLPVDLRACRVAERKVR